MKRCLAVVMALCLALQLTGCGKAKPQKGGESASKVAMKTVSLQGITYKVPEEWAQQAGETGYWHYPSSDKTAGLLNVNYMEADLSVATSENALKLGYELAFQGVQGSADNFRLDKKEYVDLAGKLAMKVTYTQTIGGRGPYTTVVYLLADVDSDIMYFLIFIMNDELAKTMNPAIDPIVNSVQFHR